MYLLHAYLPYPKERADQGAKRKGASWPVAKQTTLARLASVPNLLIIAELVTWNEIKWWNRFPVFPGNISGNASAELMIL